jgi:benzoate membrane transport protein
VTDLAGKLEMGVGFRQGINGIRRHANGTNMSAGVVAGIFNIGTLLLIMKILQEAGLPQDRIMSWVFIVFVGGGTLSILFSLYYMKPIGGAWSIAGLVLVGGALPFYSLPEAAGGFFMTGVILAILGFSGVAGSIVRWLPRPVIMAMIAGILLRFGVEIASSLHAAPLLCGVPLLVYLLSHRLFPRFPAVLGALVSGGMLAAALGLTGHMELTWQVTLPQLMIPAPTLRALIGISLPLTITVMGAENMQAMGFLMGEGYDDVPKGTRVPVNAMTAASGIGTMLVSLAGGHTINMAGVLTAICGGSGAGEDMEGRYIASMVAGLITMMFGVFSTSLVILMAAYPIELINLIAGLAMMGALISAMRAAWSGPYGHGAFFAFIVAVSGIRVLGIGAPFWALVLGILTSFILDVQDWNKRKKVC